MPPIPRRETATFWRAPEVDGLELLRATYVTHAFSRHMHETFAIGVVEAGAEQFYYRGRIHVAPAGTIVLIQPGEMHTGEAATDAGWTYRMIYPAVHLLQRVAQEVVGRHRDMPYFPNPVVRDPAAASLLRSLHRAMQMEGDGSTLERESLLSLTLARLVECHAEERPSPSPAQREHGAVRRAREYLQARASDNVSLDDLAAVAGLSPFHLLRVFKAEVGLPPHAYLTGIRVERAKRLLARGYPATYVAMEMGFTDQSHLTRHFKRLIGVTPGQYAAGSSQ